MQYARQVVVIIITDSELHDDYITLLIERVLIPWTITSAMSGCRATLNVNELYMGT
jgi:hypothetical protein